MFKKIIRGTGQMIKPFVNVPKWLGWRDLKANNKVIKDLSVGMIFPPSKEEIPAEQETFQEAVARLNLTEYKIQLRKKSFLFMTGFYAVIAAGLLIYAVYLLVFPGFMMAALISLALVWVALALAFKEHFWYTQLKYQRLGMNLTDWFNCTFKQGKSHGYK